ncbi:MAG: ROK family protein [Hyphomicrobiales bacterium]|nr:MAG: ROK family protein [Hyphomicrobiales bacterium]
MRLIGDSDFVRRQNRGLVLTALRNDGPAARTSVAEATGLSPASLTAITQDMLAQNLITEMPGTSDVKLRGRPPVLLGFNRHAAHACLVELEVGRVRYSLVDYGGTLVDRVDARLDPQLFEAADSIAYLAEGIEEMRRRNPDEAVSLRRIAISVQGVLDRSGTGLSWSPVRHLAGRDIGTALGGQFGVPVLLCKRGRLLAEGTRWRDPALRDRSVATIFIGSTVAMGMTVRGQVFGRGEEGATEFGHMNHAPGGALCRCGMHGCIEAYAADYGVLRTAYSVPENTPPAPAVPAAEYEALIQRAGRGDRAAIQAFRLAGRAIGYGLSRLLSVFDPEAVVIAGPGVRAFHLMEEEFSAALGASLVAKVKGGPEIRMLADESEPIFNGLMLHTLADIDQADFAPLPTVSIARPA